MAFFPLACIFIRNREGKQMLIQIFDLDHTVINSSHRQITDQNGNLCLKSWIANSTRAKIFADTLLPMAEFWRYCHKKGDKIVIATARTMTRHDWDFLKHHGLSFHDAIFRHRGDITPDGFLKAEGLVRKGYHEKPHLATLFDDNMSVREAVAALGIRTVCPHKFNGRVS